jgi:hypothetical protein
LAAPALEMPFRIDALQEKACPELATSEAGVSGEPRRRQVRDMKETFRLAVPRRGHVLSTVAEFYGKPVREAVAALSASLARKPHADIVRSLGSLRGLDRVTGTHRSDAEMVSWLVVSTWIAGVAIKAIPMSASLGDAEHWFFGNDATDSLTALPSGNATAMAEDLLRAQADPSTYFELLPYILDPHGPGSRLSVMRDPSTRTVRSRKRTNGVFYTPADVAQYMAGECLEALGTDMPPSLFDPACGTGVFLRAALKELRRRYPGRDVFSLASECLFGADIDPRALDATAFVLLTDTRIDSAEANASPVASWQQLRRNFVCIDTLQIDPVPDAQSLSDKDQDEGSRIRLSRLFPTLKGGPAVILGNPPYADLGARSDLAALASRFRTIAIKQEPSAEIYLAFIEQMIRLAGPSTCAGALVLPLSIACNVGPQFTAARKLIAETRGRWRFAFFDREPHALFGEDVKTRNAIVLWSRVPQDTNAVLATGPLRKWRGDSRAMMFRSLRFTPIDGDVRAGIPKIEGACQAAAFKTLCARWNRLEQAVQGISRRALATSPNADDRTVFIGPTAYNFLNVFLKPPRALLHKHLTLSEHPLHAITCASRQDAFAIFGILSSHLAYWWWHTHGDGFHVSSRFISEFPFGADAMSGRCGEVLSEWGEELWSTIRTNPIISLNRGRTSLAFTPNGHDQLRRKFDQALADLAGLEAAFVDELQQFTAHTVAAKLRGLVPMGAGHKEGV